MLSLLSVWTSSLIKILPGISDPIVTMEGLTWRNYNGNPSTIAPCSFKAEAPSFGAFISGLTGRRGSTGVEWDLRGALAGH